MTGNFLSAIRGPVLMITLGILLVIDQRETGGFGFSRTWPVLLIVFGLFKLAERAGTKTT